MQGCRSVADGWQYCSGSGAGRSVTTSHAAHTALMTLDEYQALAARTIGTRTPADQLSNMALGLAGEAGETADMLKKHLFHGKPLDADELIKELGDVLWYVAGMATAVGASLDDVAQRNVDKLRKRYPDGFSVEASARRADVVG
jgi:NTP pyrophosphatase (non-canonical NTP hydrolase)